MSTTSAQPSGQPTEQRWIIGAITADLVNLAGFAADGEHWNVPAPDAVAVCETAGEQPGGRYALSLRVPGGEPIENDLRITRSAWSPELYVPTIRALFARLKIAPPASADTSGMLPDAELLQLLTRPLTAQIEAQNQRLSDRLQTHPFDAQAHEQAALLLGTLALRENSGLLWNPRGLCNRAVAHLAFARALRGDAAEVSECGEVAELLVGLIIDTKADCQKRIAALQTRVASHAELAPWVTAAMLRNTRDYRLLPEAKDATLLERIELFRAMSEAISDDQAIKRLDNLEPATAPDWERIVLQGGCSVASGHQFALPSVSLEMQDATEVFPDLRKAQAPGQLAAIFNVPPGGPVQADASGHARLRVIDQGTWAQFFQRHLLQSADQTYNFLQNKWGVRDEAINFRMQVGSALKRLTLYPLCLDFLSKEDGEFIHGPAADLVNQHPEWVGERAWGQVVKTVPAQRARGGDWQALSRAWFSPRLPTGTAYGFDGRTDAGNFLPRPELPELEAVHDLAPLKYDVCREYVNALAPGHHPTDEQFRQAMGSLLEFYLPAMWGEAWLVRDKPARYGEVMNRAAALNPYYYLVLGKYDVEHRLEPEAAQAYQAALDQGADPVGFANDASWLVNYYYDHGQRDRALTVAKFAGDVYSFKGLETLAGLQEKMGRNDEAEATYKNIQERYNDAGPLHQFYARAASAHPGYSAGMKAAENEVFPSGMEEITLPQLSGKPTKGVFVQGENGLSKAAGLHPGAIIVGLDGKRVSNMEQYTFVRDLKDVPDLDLLVYQDGRYQAIHARVPGRKFNLNFTTWP